MPLHVGFNAYLLSAPGLRGWTRYTVNLLAALPAHGVRPVLYSTAPIHPDHLARLPADTFEIRVGPPGLRYLTWENHWLPSQLAADRIDVFHCPMNYGLPWATPCPRVLTLHDAIDTVYYGARQPWREWLRPGAVRARLAHRVARRRAHRIITVSDHAKRDIARTFGIPAARLTTTHEAADPEFHAPVPDAARAAVRARYGLGRPFVFYVGGWEERKNVPFLVRAFAAAGLPGVDLVLAGGKPEQRSALESLAGVLGIAGRLKLLGFVPDADLPALYAEALCFAYPSEYEGFGLQVVEALALGCPTFVANRTSLPEVLGTGGETFPLESPDRLAKLLNRVSTDAAFRTELQTRARVRSAFFSWDKAAAETVAVYRKALAR